MEKSSGKVVRSGAARTARTNRSIKSKCTAKYSSDVPKQKLVEP